ncbi:glycosyltransferase family 87 protein [Gemmata sp.]|uniref:glycosyltransferase family 87 protein n=1 Tax=Gemmata sp. TaxID=1914242 RepID=UPI003F6E79D6
MTVRRLVTVLALAGVALVLAAQVRDLLADPTVWPPDDYIEYWAAATLAVRGQNPYDGALLLPLERAGGRDTDEPVMMWNPPWTLAVVFPLGLLPSRAGQLLWLAVNFGAVVYCGARMWALFGGRPERWWVGVAVALAALPTAFALQSGQISPLLLLGAVLFLDFERRGYPALAGAATVLLAIKPHLAYLVWVAILCEAVRTNRWRVLVGGAAAGALCSALPLLFVPDVWNQFRDAMANRPPEQWMSPTLGTVLRMQLGEGMFRLQFVPVLAGLAWFAVYYPRWARRWDWADQVPLLVLVSFVTAPYGAWPFDMVLLLPAVVWLVVRRRAGVIGGLVAVNVGCLACNLLQTGSFWFLWVSPAVLLIYSAEVRRGPSPAPENT